jgi:Rad3-related DNA helicase
MMAGYRTLFLTSSKGLQSQLMADFGEIGMVDIRGRRNYLCILESDGTTCDHGPCVAGVKCKYKLDSRCRYFRALSAAARAQLVVTNYSFWMASNEHAGGPLGAFQMIVCDEGHGLPDIVSNWMTVTVRKNEPLLKGRVDWSIVGRFTLKQWRELARSLLASVEGEANSLADCIRTGSGDHHIRKEYLRTKSLLDGISKISKMGDDWVLDIGDTGISFSPIWPQPYMEEEMWRGTKKVVITSATLCRKTLDMLGITEDDSDYKEYPHPFPLRNRSLIHIPTIRLNHRTTDLELKRWASRIDQIIDGRLDRKGIVHTVSYARRDFLLSVSRFRDVFITHKRLDTELMVSKFRTAPPPQVLVSPSMATGWDFPGDTARFQVIGKLAYPDTRNRIIKARSVDDPDYGAYIAMQQLIQAVGRGVRSMDDWCESFIIDDNIGWFMQRYSKKFAPHWFREAFGRVSTIPVARKGGDDR